MYIDRWKGKCGYGCGRRRWWAETRATGWFPRTIGAPRTTGAWLYVDFFFYFFFFFLSRRSETTVNNTWHLWREGARGEAFKRPIIARKGKGGRGGRVTSPFERAPLLSTKGKKNFLEMNWPLFFFLLFDKKWLTRRLPFLEGTVAILLLVSLEIFLAIVFIIKLLY